MGKNWFSEYLYDDIKISLAFLKKFYKSKSSFQKIEVLETLRFGRVITLDGVIQTTEKDEFIYHEMMAHIPMFIHRNPKNILIIGGGDGGILREVLKHPINKASLVEIDEKVIDLCKKYIPSISRNSFAHKKTNIVIDDGARFVKNTTEKFDVVIVDSSDPIGPAKALFTKDFYSDIKNLLSADGIMVRQSGSSFLQSEELKGNYKILKNIFKSTLVYVAAIPSYIGGFFTFLIVSKQKNLTNSLKRNITNKWKRLNLKAKYYNPDIHRGAFATPEYIRESVK